MCDYVSKSELENPRDILEDWIKDAQDDLKDQYGITFSFGPTGSVSRNMVVRKCNMDYFDLDYILYLQKCPDNILRNCKKLKNAFRKAFDDNRPNGFSHCEDSTQALTTKNHDEGYGYDIIIFNEFSDGYYVLYNNKNKNGNNNNDYEWQKRSEMNKYHERLALIKGTNMWNYLREIYLDKRHKHKDDKESNKKASYQLFNEAVVETLDHFKIRYPKNKK